MSDTRDPLQQKLFNMYRIVYEFPDRLGGTAKKEVHCRELDLELYQKRISETGHKIIKVERIYWN